MIKIIGGYKKRTIIDVPTINVRPTSIKKREAIFSIIKSYSVKKNLNFFNNINILDLFSGSGALGLEAISRGSIYGYFYENNKNNINFLKKNCLKVCENKNFQIIQKNILDCNFEEIDKKISLVFIDPPYDTNPFEKVLEKIYAANILTKKAIIILESSKNIKINVPVYYDCFDNRIYKKTKIFFLKKNS